MTITVNIGTYDINQVKVVDSFYDALDKSFLACSFAMAYDIADYNTTGGVFGQNGVNTIALSSARPATSWVKDTTSPILQTASLNVNTGFLTLVFDEPVRANTFNGTGIVLHSRTSVYSGENLRLDYESITDSGNGLEVIIELSYVGRASEASEAVRTPAGATTRNIRTPRRGHQVN